MDDRDPAAVHRWFLSEEEVARLYPLDMPGMQYDPYTYLRRKANARFRYEFPEHPDGELFFVTNSSHLRMDGEVSAEKPDLRILVTGDSHTDGVCNNDESFAGLLESSLASSSPGRTVEVLNAGHGSYTFYNYYGVLLKFLPLEPDVFVVGVYGGNDFAEALFPWHHFRGSSFVEVGEEYDARVEAAVALDPPEGAAAVHQGFNQLVYFQHRHRQAELSLQAAGEVFGAVEELCAAHGVRLVVLYIPPPADVQPELFGDLFDRVADTLGLADYARVYGDTLADRLLDSLAARGVEVVDGRAVFAGRDELVYWRLDHHVNLRGHALLAEALRERLADLAR